MKFEFCIPTTGKAVLFGQDWLDQMKYDGTASALERDGDRVRVRVITRGGYDWTARDPMDRRERSMRG